MRFGLSEYIIEKLTQIFEVNPKVDKAVIFGSRAKGNYRPDSDIDIAVKGMDITLDDILKMQVSVEEMGIKYKVDLLDYDTIKEEAIIEHVNRVGIDIYSRWEKYKFSNFVDINPLISLKSKKEYSFVEMKDLRNGNKFCFPSDERLPASGARFQDGDTLFAKITPCLENGKICQVKGLKNGLGFGSTEFFVFRGKPNISNNEFVFYLSRWEEIREFAESNFEGTSGRQRVPKSCFDNLIIKVPPFKEQTAIADILSSLDDKIDLLHRQNKTLEELAETLFRQWFVEKQEKNTRTGKLKDLIDLTYGKGLKEEDRSGHGYPVVGSSGIVGYHSNYLIEGPGIVIGRKGTLGKVIYLFDNFFPIDTTYFVLSKSGSLGLYFEYFLLKTMNFEEFNSDSAVPGLNRDIALGAEINIPSNEQISEYNNYCSSFFQKIKINTNQVHTLTQLRDNLLPKLMSGEVRVRLD